MRKYGGKIKMKIQLGKRQFLPILHSGLVHRTKPPIGRSKAEPQSTDLKIQKSQFSLSLKPQQIIPKSFETPLE